jgi:predicted DNA-binding transcriptional regulator AlpA
MAKHVPHSEERFLTAAQLAPLLCVSEDWVYERAKSGDLPSFKLPGGRRIFRWSEIVATLEERYREGGSMPRPRAA